MSRELVTVLKDARNFESAHVAENYPYGFKLRTKMYSWIEHTKAGARLVQQTINPKNGRLNAPKKTTYSSFLLLGLDENGHIITDGFGKYSKTESIQEFLETYSEYMTESEIKEAMTLIKVKNLISERWENAEREAKEKETLPTEEIKEDQIIKPSEITNYHGDISLWNLALVGYAVKNGCRKKDFAHIDLGFVKRDGKIAEERVNKTMADLADDVKKALANYKSHELKFAWQEVDYSKTKGDLFHSIKRDLFSCTKLTYSV